MFCLVVQSLGVHSLFGKGRQENPEKNSQSLDNFSSIFHQINVETMRFLLSMKKATKNRFTGGYQPFTWIWKWSVVGKNENHSP